MQIAWPRYQQKLISIIYISLFLFLIIIARLFYLQITLSDLFIKKGTRNFLRTEQIISPRGNIMDRHNTLIATNRPTIDLYWQGHGIYPVGNQQKEILTHLEAIIECPFPIDDALLTKISKAEYQHAAFLLAHDISFEQLSKIEEQLSDTVHLMIKTGFKRFYPYNNYASHVIGYLGNVNLKSIGKMGLEKIFEDQLQGSHGTILKTINSKGKNLNQSLIKPSCTGNTIVTTLDMGIQSIAEEIFPHHYQGTCIIMDPYDGDILALVSRPSFDPTTFLDHIDHTSWQSMQNLQPFLNRACNAHYPPGSIFKLITTSAALETGVVHTEASWYCKGFVSFGNRKYWCNNRAGHGEMSLKNGIAHSCNTMFFELAQQLSIDTLADYANRFGLGQRTEIPFAEKIGIVPNSKWKRETKGERWWPGETLSAAIGQSYLLVSPLQIARMISSIFTGTLVKPRILIDEPIKSQPLLIQEETRKFLQESMLYTIKTGTGRQINKVKDIEVYAKTSTAQTSSYNKRCLGSIYLEHGWFTGYIRYKEQRPLTIVILVEHAGAARVATDIAKQFLTRYKYMIDQAV